MQRTRLAVDIGGTFTDAVLDRGGALTSAKVPTTPDAPERGFLHGAEQVMDLAGVAAEEVSSMVHGTTLATNALIERKGARTALVTTEGFRDSLAIGYESRHDQYDLDLEKPEPLVPRELRFCVRERTSARGESLVDLDEGALHGLAARLRAERVEAVAIGFLHAYANPAHERRARRILALELPGVAICLSCEVCPEIREYERLSTTVANAYLQPAMARYLGSLQRQLHDAGLRAPVFIVTSAGGVTTVETAIRFPIRLVESGPSGGAVLAEMTAEAGAEQRVVSYDMGGTTAKICLVDGYGAATAREFEAARTARFTRGSGLPLRIPVVEMIEIGAGGGSIARVDALRRIAVGPDSAGAEPGPACYAKGGCAPTVTDADLALGRLDPDRFAESRMVLDEARAARAIHTAISAPLNLDTTAAAAGICEMVDETMANAARVHAAEHGADLGKYVLMAFGGAGPVHAARIAQKLGIKRIIVPPNPGVGSAVGFLWMPVSYEVVRSRYMTLSAFEAGPVNDLLAQLSRDAHEVVRAAALHEELIERRTALMRYRGQGHEVEVSLPTGTLDATSADEIRSEYLRLYRKFYGRELPGGEIEVLTWSVSVSTPRRVVPPIADARERPAPLPAVRARPVCDEASGRLVETPVHWRADLPPGTRIGGPVLLVEAQTTTVVPAGFMVGVRGDGTLVLDRCGAAPEVAATTAAHATQDVALQVVWNRLQSIVDEQAGVLMRTAFSPIVRESGDLSAGVFDVDGNMLAQAVTGTPGHVNTMASACRSFFLPFPRNAMADSDVYLTNDPWQGAGHLNDFVLLKPCFHHGRLVAFLSCTSHLVDIGGRCLGPDGSDVYDEGLYVPPIKLVDGGRLNETFMALLAANSRSPTQAEGDVFALIACCESGERRLAEMMDDFVLSDLIEVSERILAVSEAATSERIHALPDGRYAYEMTVDGYEEPVTLKARLDIAGDRIALDFFESAAPSQYGINVPVNYTQAYAVFGLKCAIAPDIPNNHGSLRPFSVTAAPDTLLNARKPAPVASRHVLGQLLPDVALGCLRAVLPGVIPAEGASTLWDLPMKGVLGARRGGAAQPFAAELVFNGGTGARPGKDGLSATAYPSGVMGSLVEVTESVTPILIRRRELRPDSGGPGMFRGGLGQIIEVEALPGVPLIIYGTVDRVKHPARGRDGGGCGATGRFEHCAGTAFTGKGALHLGPAERLLVRTPGGGGFGDPLRREAALVAADVAGGLVSAAAAHSVYGVVFTAQGTLDTEATRRRRLGHSGGA